MRWILKKTELANPSLYNVNHDPSEKYDHAKDEPEKLAELVALADKYRTSVEAAECELNKYPVEKPTTPDREHN